MLSFPKLKKVLRLRGAYFLHRFMQGVVSF
nr:MAG TPA: hypothetical protein [Caudoviricetes sp.]